MVVQSNGEFRDRGDKLKKEGRIGEAIDFYQQEIELAPHCDISYFKLGKLFKEEGKIVNARIYYRQAIKINPDNSWGNHELGEISVQLGQLAEAIEYYKRAIKLNPNFSWSYYNLGRILHQQNNLEAAKGFYKKAIELNPNNPWVDDFLAEIEIKQEHCRAAIACYNSSSTLNAEYLEIYRTLEKSLLNLSPEQLVEYRQNLQTNSAIEKACIETYLGQAWQELNQLEQAISCYERAIEFEPYFELPYQLIGKIHGNLENQKNYQKFLILCHPRTGSNFLVSLLQSHSQIRVNGEMFSEDNQLYWGYSGYNSPRIAELKNEDPIFFIERLIYRDNFPKFVKAVGFKLFYFQLKQGKQNIIWQYLKEIADLKIIHLTRKNLFHLYVSYQIAQKTNQWDLRTKKNTQRISLLEPIFVDHEKCLQQFKLIKHWEKKYSNFFDLSSQQYCNITYENLVSNTQQETDKIQEFIGVAQRPLTSHTKKQGIKPMRKIVANYDELKEKFYNSCWSNFFDE